MHHPTDRIKKINKKIIIIIIIIAKATVTLSLLDNLAKCYSIKYVQLLDNHVVIFKANINNK